MRPRRLPSTTRIAAATVAAALLTACASRKPRDAPENVEMTPFAASTSWLGGDRSKEGTERAGFESASPSMRPTDPWVGAVGLKFGVRDQYEVGVGLCVPTSAVGGYAVDFAEIGRARDTAVGVWVKFDF
jgi:hypothetical protein